MAADILSEAECYTGTRDNGSISAATQHHQHSKGHARNYPQSACVLTSEQCIMALEEKAEEKKRKLEGKERTRKREMK